MASRIVVNVNGEKRLRQWTPGPKPQGFVKVLVNIPAEHLAVMQFVNHQCGGMMPVSQQIRDAIRANLCGLVYISQQKQ